MGLEYNKSILTDGVYYTCFESTYYKVTNSNGILTYEVIESSDIFLDLRNENIIGSQQDITRIGYLEKCFEDKLKYIIYNNLYKKCNDKLVNIQGLYRERDILLMFIETIKFAVKSCKLHEAQRLIEQLEGCNGLCGNNVIGVNSNCKTCR